MPSDRDNGDRGEEWNRGLTSQSTDANWRGSSARMLLVVTIVVLTGGGVALYFMLWR
jgi:hypothetical protein